jgi:muconolactone delta-isomerase
LGGLKEAFGFMQFLTISQLRAGASGEACASLREEESCRARTLYREGHIRQIWHRGDMTGACLLWEADSENQVREMLNTLPFVKASLLEVTVIPLKPYAANVLENGGRS